MTAFPTVVAILIAGAGAEVALGDSSIAVWALISISVVQLATYLALEVAMLTQNLMSETSRLLDRFESSDPES